MDTVNEPTIAEAHVTEILAETEVVVRDDIKEIMSDTYLAVAKGRAKIKAISEKPVNTTTEGGMSDLKKPTCVSRLSPVRMTESQKISKSKLFKFIQYTICRGWPGR